MLTVRYSDRVFGHALNTVNKIRPGSQKPPTSDRLTLYGLYKQAMEGDVSAIADRPTVVTQPGLSPDQLRKEHEKWDAWKDNEGVSRTESKRRYIEKLIDTMHQYASNTDEARQLVEELEFVWDQIKSNSQHASSERSSPLREVSRSGYMQNSSFGGNGGSSAAAMEGGAVGAGSKELRLLSPVSQADEEEMMEEEQEEFVDAPVSQVDPADLRAPSEEGEKGRMKNPRTTLQRMGDALMPRRQEFAGGDAKWRKRVESSLFKLTTEVAALREQLEDHRFLKTRRKNSILGWILRAGWWAVQFVLADAVVLWIVLWYLRRKQDRRLEGAIRVLLGDAVAQVQKVAKDARIPVLPRMPQIKGKKNG